VVAVRCKERVIRLRSHQPCECTLLRNGNGPSPRKRIAGGPYSTASRFGPPDGRYGS
jgi:hypothetical protein